MITYISYLMVLRELETYGMDNIFHLWGGWSTIMQSPSGVWFKVTAGETEYSVEILNNFLNERRVSYVDQTVKTVAYRLYCAMSNRKMDDRTIEGEAVELTTSPQDGD